MEGLGAVVVWREFNFLLYEIKTMPNIISV